MKTALTIFALLLSSAMLGMTEKHKDPISEDDSQYAIECRKEHGVTKEQYQAIFSIDEPAEVDAHVKCVLQCILVKEGLMNDNGELLKDALEASFDQYDIENVTATDLIDKCGGLKGESSCDTAYQIVNCAQAEMHGNA